jgi:hypothetical protein
METKMKIINKFNKISLVVFGLLIHTSAMAACDSIVGAKVLACAEVPVHKDLSLAITDGDDGISLALLKANKEVSSVKGLGFELEKFNYLGVAVDYKVFTPNKYANGVIAVRVKNDTTSLISFFKITDSKLVLLPVADKAEKDKKDFVVVNYGVEVKIDTVGVNVFDPRYSAFYVFEADELVLKKYKLKSTPQ